MKTIGKIFWTALSTLSTACMSVDANAAQSPPVVTVPDVTCVENAACTLVITKTKANSYSKIMLETVDGTAKAGTDYRALSTTITLSNNATRTTVPLTLIDNTIYQGSRTLGIRVTIVRFAQLPQTYVPTVVTIADDEAQPPAPTPPPSPTPDPTQPTGLAGETPIADTFDITTAVEPTWYGPCVGYTCSPGRGGTPFKSADPVGSFRMFCGPGQILKDDFMVYFGLPGASPHAHQFFGNLSANAFSTYPSLRTSGETTCGQASTPANRTAMWTPAAKVTIAGIDYYQKPDYMNLYYKRDPDSDPLCKKLPSQGGVGICADLPNGYRLIFGANMSTMTDGPTDVNSQNHDAIQFQCWPSEDGTVSNNGLNAYYHSIKEVIDAGCPVGARLMIIAAAPNCWDGQRLDSVDHRSHAAFSNGAMYAGQMFRACPEDHPYVLPNVEVQIAYTLGPEKATLRLDSDDQMTRMGFPGPAGWTWHMDYGEAWSPVVKFTWHKNCINMLLSCASGDLGNGTYIIGAGVPAGGWLKHQLVPVSSVQ